MPHELQYSAAGRKQGRVRRTSGLSGRALKQQVELIAWGCDCKRCALRPAVLGQGVAAGNLKLENMLLDRDGQDGTRPLLKVCDFGCWKHEMNSPAKTGVGTPIYMAPEIIYGGNRYDAKVHGRLYHWHSPHELFQSVGISFSPKHMPKPD